MSTSALPPRPDLEQLRKQAKDLHKALRSGDTTAAGRLRANLPRFARSSDHDGANASLKDAQKVLARELGFDNWPALRRHVTGEPRYFDDYRYSQQEPVGVGEHAKAPGGRRYYVFVSADGGIAVEEFDQHGAFARLCYHPSERQYHRRWSKERVADGTGAVVRDTDGSVVLYEKYQFMDVSCADGPLVRSETYTAEGRLIEVQEPTKVSETGYDLRITDGCGKTKGTIRHRNVDRGEPVDIEEVWLR